MRLTVVGFALGIPLFVVLDSAPPLVTQLSECSSSICFERRCRRAVIGVPAK